MKVDEEKHGIRILLQSVFCLILFLIAIFLVLQGAFFIYIHCGEIMLVSISVLIAMSLPTIGLTVYSIYDEVKYLLEKED